MKQPARAWWAPPLEVAGVTAFLALLGASLVELANGISTAGHLGLLLLGAALGYLLADFLSGCAHWFCDTFFDSKTPVIGPLLIAPFREHHEDPQSITRHRFLELNGNSALALAPLLGWNWWRGAATGASPGPAAMLAQATLCFGALALVATNQLHRWAHEPQPPAAVRWMQRHRLILAPEDHARHHRRPHRRAYCITTGWMNAPLDRLRFFQRCERALGVLRMRRGANGAAGFPSGVV